MTEAETRGHWQARLGLTDEQADELVADSWRWYVGTLDRPLFDWFAGLRARGLRTGILSNSGPGAREAERRYGFETVTDDIVYSHEVGLKKPDPAVYELTASRLGVRAGRDRVPRRRHRQRGRARAAGWQAVLHQETGRSIAELEAIIAGAAVRSGVSRASTLRRSRGRPKRLRPFGRSSLGLPRRGRGSRSRRWPGGGLLRVFRQRGRALSRWLPGISHGAQSQCSSHTK